MNYKRLSHLLSKALRHKPQILNLELDEFWACDVQYLLEQLRKKHEYKDIELQDLYDMMDHIDKKRYAIESGKIRALYGHSFPIKIKYEAIKPPMYLYHGTNFNAYQSIKKEGLCSMKRQYVHLSNDLETAIKVALRSTKSPLILKINALDAYHNGVIFHYANDNTYLCDHLDIEYINLLEDYS